jgi:hypothetical protein
MLCALLSAPAACLCAQEADPDWLGVARRYADHMLEFGCDRWGPVHSPLFVNGLTREEEPRLAPYPRYVAALAERRIVKRETEDAAKLKKYPSRSFTPFVLFDFNNVLNYPPKLASEGPHKVTIYGADPYEDQDLYGLLEDLARLTDDTRYAAAREAALTWWFANTQGPTGLYPWGEHLGWDPVHEQPTYFEWPARLLYHAAYHEIKNATPFLDVLARVSVKRLEDYAWGVWQTHFWDKERARYDRHGDYLGQDNRLGEPGGFPAHLGAYFDIWTSAYLASEDEAFKAKMADVMRRVAAMIVERSETYGGTQRDVRRVSVRLHAGLTGRETA